MESNNYDAGSDLEGNFPEEFRIYVRDLNLLKFHSNGWLFRSKHESDADRYITAKLASLVNSWFYHAGQCLVQFWRAQEVTSIGDLGERRFHLTSRNQPFMFVRSYNDCTPFSKEFCSYRMKMVDFISRDGGGDGVIGRVFRNNRPECFPNIGYYSYEEYSHQDLALSCHIKSTLAFPLSDSSGHSGGVVEIVSLVQLNRLIEPYLHVIRDFLGYKNYKNCCMSICGQHPSLHEAVSEIKEVMQLVGQSCCLLCAQTWMPCNGCSRISTSGILANNLAEFFTKEYIEYDVWSNLCNLKRGEGVVGKAATSSYNLVYCDDVSQFSITEYPLAPYARYHKLTDCFATCLRSNRTGNRIYVLEFFLNPSKVNGRGPRAKLVPILEGMRKNFQTFKLASGEEIGDNLSVQVIEARFPDKFEILEIGKLDSVENYTFEMNNATISSIGVINLNLSLQPLVKPNVIHTEESVGSAAKMLNGELPPRNGIDISLEELKEVSVNVSTLKRVPGSFGISRWPPRSGNSAQTGSTKELRGSASTVQSDSLVTIKAKYGDDFIKFKHSASSGINAFNQQVLKRLKLETGSYVVKYQDDDNDWILVACDDDLRDYISSSASLGKTTLTMLLEHI